MPAYRRGPCKIGASCAPTTPCSAALQGSPVSGDSLTHRGATGPNFCPGAAAAFVRHGLPRDDPARRPRPRGASGARVRSRARRERRDPPRGAAPHRPRSRGPERRAPGGQAGRRDAHACTGGEGQWSVDSPPDRPPPVPPRCSKRTTRRPTAASSSASSTRLAVSPMRRGSAASRPTLRDVNAAIASCHRYAARECQVVLPVRVRPPAHRRQRRPAGRRRATQSSSSSRGDDGPGEGDPADIAKAGGAP